MTRSFTADESKSQAIEQMGEPLGQVYHALWLDVAWLHLKWTEYVELFGTKPSRVELLNKTAPLFFRTVQNVFWNDTIIHIARLTDRPVSPGGKTNLTIQALPGLVADDTAGAEISGLVTTALATAKFCRDRRDRQIAHCDLQLVTSNGARPLAPANRAAVKNALNAIADVLNAVSQRYLNSDLTFNVIHKSTGALGLLYVLDDGLRAEAERRTRIQMRQMQVDDLAARDL